MGGFLGALAPIGQTLSGQFQLGAMRQQQQANRDAFGKALENLPPNPEYDMMRQMWKAGASPEAVTNVLGGPIGEALQKEHQRQLWSDFVGPGGIKDLTPEKIWEGVRRGVFTGEEGLKYNEDLMKYQAEMAKLQTAGLPKLSSNFNTFLATKGLTQQDMQQMSQPQRDQLSRDFEQMYNLGPGATTLKLLHNFNTGNDELTAVPAHPEAGQVVGYGKPPAGGNPIAMLGAVQDGMNATLDLLKPYGDSNVPMQLPAELMKKGIAPSAEYVHLSDEVGAVYTTLNMMIMRSGGFRNVAAAMDFMSTHVPQPGVDSPRTIKLKLDQWMEPGPGGLMNIYRKMLGANMYVVPTKSGVLTGEPMPAPGTGGGAGAEPPPDLEDVHP